MSESAPEPTESSGESPVATAAAIAAAEASGAAEATAEHAEETAESAEATAEVTGEVAVEAAQVATQADEKADTSLSISEKILAAQEAQREEMAGIRQLLLDRQESESSTETEVTEVPVGGSEKERPTAGDRDTKSGTETSADKPPPGPENAPPKRGLRRRNRG